MSPDRLGLVIGATFGLVWVEVNAGAAPSPVDLVLRVLGALVFAGILAALWRARGPRPAGGAQRPGFGRGFWLVVAVEAIAFFGGNLLLNGPLGLPEGVVAWIAVVVGVHFVALARVWGERSVGWVGGGVALLGAVGLGMAVAGVSDDGIALTAGVGTGIVLLGGCGWAALRGSRPVAAG
ncbi:hypothetical protein [Actinocorallia populi]|uniref:hypothetical protein n=1 Tax=Actinocorallia populi TaxID=2079200 RepID=UPI000D092D32|nr:hypothetical protein [Actinocorallia populi]